MVFSQTFGFSKIRFKFCLKPLLLENHMYFWTNSIWMFLIFFPFNSLKCYFVKVICLGSNLILLENLWKTLLLKWETNFCLSLSVYAQSKLEIIWIRGSWSVIQSQHQHHHLDAEPSHTEGPRAAVDIFHFFFFFLSVLWLELKASMLARQALYHLNHSSSPFCSGNFGVIFCPGQPGLWFTYFTLHTIAGMTDVHHHTQLLSIEMGSHRIFFCIN
jgi:hypothetical protein